MKTDRKSAVAARNHKRFKRWTIWGMALVSCTAGSFFTARLMHVRQVRADSDRVFELMIYHTLPGKAPALEAIFRDASKLQSDHGLKVVGYWVPSGEDPGWANTFVYLLAHSSRDEAKKNWHALHADPAFQPYVKAASELIEKSGEHYKVDEVYMHPTDFSAMK